MAANESVGKMDARGRQEDELTYLNTEIDRIQRAASEVLKNVKELLSAMQNVDKIDKKCMTNLRKSPLASVHSKMGNDQFRLTVAAWNQSVDDMEKSTSHLASVSKKTVQEPIKEYLKVIADCLNCLRKRQLAVQERAKAAVRWQKIEKDGKYSVTTAKLNEAVLDLSQTESLVADLEANLCRNMSTITARTPDVFENLLLSSAISQMQHYRSNYTTLNRFVRETASSVGLDADGVDEASLQTEMQSLNNQLEALSIVRANSGSPAIPKRKISDHTKH